MTIKFIKLITNASLVSEIEENPNGYMLKWPMELTDRPDAAEGEPKIRVEPYTPHVKGHCVQIDRSSVLYIGDPVPPLREYYEKNVSSMVPTFLSGEQGQNGVAEPAEIPVSQNEDGTLEVK